MKSEKQLLKRLDSTSRTIARIKGVAKEQTELAIEVSSEQGGAFTAGLVDGYLVDDTIGDGNFKYSTAAGLVVGLGAALFGRKPLGKMGQKAAVHFGSGLVMPATYGAGVKAGEAVRKKVD